jgi:hypothetical protein
MFHSIGKAVLAGLFAASAMGCASYEVTPGDRDSFALAKVQAAQAIEVVERAKRPELEDPALKESLSRARSNERELAGLLAKKKLEPEEVRQLQALLAAYRSGLAELARDAREDRERYTLGDDPIRAEKLQAFVDKLERSVSHIDENLNKYLESHKKEFSDGLHTTFDVLHETAALNNELRNHQGAAAPVRREEFDQQLTTTVASLGGTLDALERKLDQKLARRIEALVGDPERIEAVKRKVAATDAAILEWMKAVDASLKAMAASGAVAPGFLQADRLTSALAIAMGEEWEKPVGADLKAGIETFETIVVVAKAAGVEPGEWIATFSAEFSKVVASYEALHAQAARVTRGPGSS